MKGEDTMSIFKIVSLILAVSAFIKGLTGLLFHRSLYSWAEKHYASKKISPTVILLIIYAISILIFTWYATIFNYIKHGWILTTFISITSIKLLAIIFKWNETSAYFVKFISLSGKRLWILDIAVLLLGFVFLGMASYLY